MLKSYFQRDTVTSFLNLGTKLQRLFLVKAGFVRIMQVVEIILFSYRSFYPVWQLLQTVIPLRRKNRIKNTRGATSRYTSQFEKQFLTAYWRIEIKSPCKSKGAQQRQEFAHYLRFIELISFSTRLMPSVWFMRSNWRLINSSSLISASLFLRSAGACFSNS